MDKWKGMGNEAGKMNAKGWIHRGWSSWEMCKKKKKKKKESGKTKKSTTMNPWRSILMDSWRGLLNFTCTTKQCNNLQWFSFSFYSSFAFNTRASNFLIYFIASFNAWNTRVCKCVHVIYVHNPWKKKKKKRN